MSMTALDSPQLLRELVGAADSVELKSVWPTAKSSRHRLRWGSIRAAHDLGRSSTSTRLT
jgi:hypothetical protein